MNFIDELKNENTQKKLFEAFDTAYDREFNYEIIFYKNKNSALFTINTTENSFVTNYIMENFNLLPMCPNEDYITERYYGVTDEKSREVYLSFMKKTFPDYQNYYVKNLEKIKNNQIEEINSL